LEEGREVVVFSHGFTVYFARKCREKMSEKQINMDFSFFYRVVRRIFAKKTVMKRISTILALLFAVQGLSYAAQAGDDVPADEWMPFGDGRITVTPVARNAVRIRYAVGEVRDTLPAWLYPAPLVKATSPDGISVNVDAARQVVTVRNGEGEAVLSAVGHRFVDGDATLTVASPEDECLYGLGQFQDGYTNVRGLTRRLTQVNTQISIPMLLSSKGYGVLWNNYGLVDFNPATQLVRLAKSGGAGQREVVHATSTAGDRREVRQRHIFEGAIDIAEPGDYALMLDVGQKMARRHNLSIDGQTVIDMQNVWLPPTASVIVKLSAGHHTLSAELSDGDRPTVGFRRVNNETVLHSPVAGAVDYTVFVGTPDEIISTYRNLTGPAPLMPEWALGYIHCRERFHSSDEILKTAARFRQEQLPVSVMVQDWQYWGKYGWNAMQFDEDYYPNPRALTDSLHRMGMRLMLSVWSKIDKNSEVGRDMERSGYYIPGTDWIDFFNPAAATAYWQNFSRRLVPLGIDAWWQDATEPENDDLAGRRVAGGRWDGELVRNVYPLLVNQTVYEGLRKDNPTLRPMILTRCGFPGIQRYGAAMWSGDVGNDWETLRRQLAAGLGMQAAGIPWWTYDAGGFFRPGNQYSDAGYIERMLRWIEASVYLPLMRVHGYMSNTEPWNYGPEAQEVIAGCLRERYRLLPYIYSNAAAVTFEGSTLMRPLVFDFADDAEALRQQHEWMFGRALLVCPITEAAVTEWDCYLPKTEGGWYDYHSSRHYAGGQTVTVAASPAHIPVFAKAGSILPTRQTTDVRPQTADLTIAVYPGADADFTLYEDDGVSNDYEQGRCSRITFRWDDARRRLHISRCEGRYEGMPKHRVFRIVLPDGTMKNVRYKGRQMKMIL